MSYTVLIVYSNRWGSNQQSHLSSSVVKMISDPSEEKIKSSTRVRMHLGEFPRQTSPEVYVSGLATLGILFAAQNFHHSLLLVHPPEELLAGNVRSLFYGCVLLPICGLSSKWFAPVQPYSEVPH